MRRVRSLRRLSRSDGKRNVHQNCCRRFCRPRAVLPTASHEARVKPPVPSEPAETLRVRDSRFEAASECAGSSVALAAAAQTDNFAAALAEQADSEDRTASRSWSGRLARSRLAKLGRLVTLVPQLLEAEDQAEKADTTGAQATAAVLSSVRCHATKRSWRRPREPTSPRSLAKGSTRRPPTLRGHVKRWVGLT